MFAVQKRFPVLLKVLAESRHCGGFLAPIAGLSLLSLPFTLLYPLPLKIAVDSVINRGPLPGFVTVLAPIHTVASGLLLAVLLVLLIALLVNLQGLATW